MRSIVKIDLPEKCRIIAVSDIHTCWRLLDKMLDEVSYEPKKDYLVIVGDILEHWNDNINTLKYVKQLCDNSKKVICLLGNNDRFCVRMTYTYPYEKFAEKFDFRENTFKQMAMSLGYSKCSRSNWIEIRDAVKNTYGYLIDFITSLPICLVTQDHVFVHAGVENRADWENTDDDYALTKSWFMRDENPTGKWMVVGHFPTYNYKRSHSTNMPLIDHKKKMICIDGGLAVKTACQMNLFVINKNGNKYIYENYWKSPFPKYMIKENFISCYKPMYVDWSNQDIRVLEYKNGLYKLKDNVTGVIGYIPKREVYKNHSGGIKVYQSLSAFPTVQQGENVNVCAIDGSYALVITEDGNVGWIPKNVIDFK